MTRVPRARWPPRRDRRLRSGDLACADELEKLAYRVTIFESLLLPGGLLVTGLPACKFEKSIVARRVDLFAKRGVEQALPFPIQKTSTPHSAGSRA